MGSSQSSEDKCQWHTQPQREHRYDLPLPKGLGTVVTEGSGRVQEAEVRGQEQASVFWA